MKNVILYTILVFLLFGFLPNKNLNAQAKKPHEDPKYGQDSASRMECIKNLSLYSEFYKQNNYDDAYTPWSYTIENCPMATKNLANGVND